MSNLLHRYDYLLLPCRDNAGPDHWQSHWEKALPNVLRVEQDEWIVPKFAPWAARLDEYVARCHRKIVLIGHSLGTSLVMQWGGRAPRPQIAGAFLVAPSDRGPADIWSDAAASGFAPMVLEPLPFPSMVLAARNDPYVAFDRARGFAEAWGSALVDMGQAGHMGNDHRLGLWPEGVFHLGAFVASLAPGR